MSTRTRDTEAEVVKGRAPIPEGVGKRGAYKSRWARELAGMEPGDSVIVATRNQSIGARVRMQAWGWSWKTKQRADGRYQVWRVK